MGDIVKDSLEIKEIGTGYKSKCKSLKVALQLYCFLDWVEWINQNLEWRDMSHDKKVKFSA